jgi:hypothetical protein
VKMAPERASNAPVAGTKRSLCDTSRRTCPPLPFPVAPKPLAHADHQRKHHGSVRKRGFPIVRQQAVI